MVDDCTCVIAYWLTRCVNVKEVMRGSICSVCINMQTTTQGNSTGCNLPHIYPLA